MYAGCARDRGKVRRPHLTVYFPEDLMSVPEKIRALVAHCNPLVTPGARRRIGAVARRRGLVPESALLAYTATRHTGPKLNPLPTTEDNGDRKLIAAIALRDQVRFAP